MSEFVQDNVVNVYINTVYQSIYTKTDRGVKNGEIDLIINTQENEQYIASQIKQYFDGIYSSPTINIKKYHISIDVQYQELHINIKWGHHAIVANNIGEPLDQP